MQESQTTDEQLLRDHIAHRDEVSFAQLVRRHVNLVFGTALRILGDRTAAEEVTQNVFITLARKATSIRVGTGLAGWLHRAATLEARLRQRTDLRRQKREDLAAQLGTTMPTPESPDPLPFEILDEALLELPEKDRRTLFLRYFENRPFREIANSLGIGEDAAQKRTSRALDALAGILRRRGAATVTATLAAKTLEAAALTIAPAQLATSITSVALVTPALPDRGHAIRDDLRQALIQLLGTERANLVWQQAERTFENEFNQFGAVERIEAAAFNGPGNLSRWNAARDLDGKLTSWGNSGGNLSIDTFPLRLRPIVAGWLTNSQPQRP